MTELNPTFCRRLLTAHLIDQVERPNLPELMQRTGWPRRTLQDIIKALPGMGIRVAFEQDGVRHNDGYYRLDDWGPIDARWVHAHLDRIAELLELDLP